MGDLNAATHEASHGIIASLAGRTVETVQLRPESYTFLTADYKLHGKHANHGAFFMADAMTLMAGYEGETVLCGQASANASRDDRQQLRAIGEVYAEKYGAPWVVRHTALARSKLAGLLSEPRVQECIKKLARVSLQKDAMSGQELSRFLTMVK